MILYVARATEGDPRCGATKLNKILFYADFWAYRKLGRSISGQEYQKLEYGPAPRRIKPTVRAMESERECVWAEREYHGFPLDKLVALRDPEISVFAAEEIDILRNVVDELWELNATEVSDLSHRFVGWKAAGHGETIPYETVFVGEPRPLTADELRWAHQVIDEYVAGETS